MRTDQQPKTRYEIETDYYREHLRMARNCQSPSVKRKHQEMANRHLREIHKLTDILPFEIVAKSLGWKRIGAKNCQFCQKPMPATTEVCPTCLLIQT